MQYRDIDWCVKFEITVNGEEASFEDLTEEEQKKILRDIFEDYYYGTFLGDECDDYEDDIDEYAAAEEEDY